MATRTRRKTSSSFGGNETKSSPIQENPESSCDSTSFRSIERPQKRKAPARQTLEYGSEALTTFRHCEKVNCLSTTPVCFAEATEKCARTTGTTSRWYHLSPGEHFCNECYDNFYRSHKDGCAEYIAWKKMWSSNGTTEPNIKAFMNDQILPYWAHCKMCKKWRALPRSILLTKQFVEEFDCAKLPDLLCATPEDARVGATRDAHWIDTLVLPPYLKMSPAAPYVTDYFPDWVGMSSSEERIRSDSPKRIHKYLQPFQDPNGSPVAAAVRPDLMERDETIEFPEFTYAQQMYLGLRNLVVTLWSQNPREWLTAEKCAPFVICRGLARIRCMQEVEHIVYFLTRKGIINTGLLPQPVPADLKHESKCKVVVVGSGVAGLAAARQLHNLGVSVLVVEARSYLGGRFQAAHLSAGVVASLSADAIGGVINNPLSMLCIQGGLRIQEHQSQCLYLRSDGSAVSRDVQSKMEFHFSSLLDVVAEFYKVDTKPADDTNLQDKLMQTHRVAVEECDRQFSEEEELLLQAQMRELELSTGVRLLSLSAKHWDQHEMFAQFNDQLFSVAEGLEAVLQKIAEPLDVRLNSAVTKIEFTADGVNVHTNNEVLSCSKVIIAVPLSMLKEGRIAFEPPLPPSKTLAMQSLGIGRLEKLLLQFPTNFWSEKVSGLPRFCILGAVQAAKPFSTFTDLSAFLNGAPVLATFFIDDEVNCFGKKKTNAEIVEEALANLRNAFGNNEVPLPVGYFISRWNADEFVRMSNSYLPVGSGPFAYDTISEEVGERLYFAGEASMKSHPQTVTGAYLSGIREAVKIISTLQA